jgi:hypothetical protein
LGKTETLGFMGSALQQLDSEESPAARSVKLQFEAVSREAFVELI